MNAEVGLKQLRDISHSDFIVNRTPEKNRPEKDWPWPLGGGRCRNTEITCIESKEIKTQHSRCYLRDLRAKLGLCISPKAFGNPPMPSGSD